MKISPSHSTSLSACRDCDLLLCEPFQKSPVRSRCPRCGCVLQDLRPDSSARCLAASCAGLILLVPALSLPLLHFEMFGRGQHTSVLGSIIALVGQQQWWLALLVLICAVIVPLLQLLTMALASAAQLLERRPKALRPLLRWSFRLQEWGMLEIYLLAVGVTLFKLEDDGGVLLDTGLYCLIALLLCSLVATMHFDRRQVWQHWGTPPAKASFPS